MDRQKILKRLETVLDKEYAVVIKDLHTGLFHNYTAKSGNISNAIKAAEDLALEESGNYIPGMLQVIRAEIVRIPSASEIEGTLESVVNVELGIAFGNKGN